MAVDTLLYQLDQARDVSEVVLDFSNVSWAYPHAALIAAAAISHLRDYRSGRGLSTKFFEVGVRAGTRAPGAEYLAHMGFFRFLGIPHGNEPGQAAGGSRYVPIMRLSRSELSPGTDSTALLNAIREQSYKLARIISADESAQELLAYCFRETIRNVFEHSMADTCVLMAQRYGAEVQIAVVDFGRGIQASLSEVFAGIGEQEALEQAIRPGISRSVFDEGRGQWENTGFGLFVLSELGRINGEFSLWSRSQRLSIQAEEPQACITTPRLDGTAVSVKIRTSDAEYFPNLLHDIVARGEAEVVPGAVAKSGNSKSRVVGWSGSAT